MILIYNVLNRCVNTNNDNNESINYDKKNSNEKDTSNDFQILSNVKIELWLRFKESEKEKLL